MKYDSLHKGRGFRTGKDLLSLLNSEEKPSPGRNIALPSNEAESTLYAIWKSLLGHHNFGVKDDFLRVGGDSVKAVQLVSRIYRDFSVLIQLTEIFLQSTIEQLATHILAQNKDLISSSIIKTQSRPESIPLSFSQERLWFIDRLEGSVHYHTADVFHLKGELNKAALEHALKMIVNRHEVLRTIFLDEEGKPFQYIKEANSWLLQTSNGFQYQNDAIGLQKFIDRLVNEPFDLSKEDMIRVHLIIVNEHEHLMVITMHHIASDGWSLHIFIEELVELYNSYVAGRPALLEPMYLQYADYAIWQRQYLQGELLDKKVIYWKEKLDGVVPLQLPTDYLRPVVQSSEGSLARFNINKTLSNPLKQLSYERNTTLFMTLLAAFKVLLFRYSGQRDICVGTPIMGRQQQEVEGLIGFFVNTLALRSEVTSNISFIDFLQQVKATTLEAYDHQEAPFEKVVNTIVKERDMSRNPLFQVLFVLQNTPAVPTLSLGNLTLSRKEYTHNTSKFDLSFFISESENGLDLSVEYCTDLFTEQTIARMVGHFMELLFSIVKDPFQQVGKLQMLSKAEEHQLLVEFNDTEVAYPKDKTVIELFEDQVAKTPDNIAVVFEKEHLTYHELNKRANQAAYYLRSRGVKEETLVPICIERSLEMIVGVLAILKAGGAYVPIDPEYPQHRINYMVEDTAAFIILSSKKSSIKIQITKGIEIVEIDADWFQISEQPFINFQTTSAPNNLVYVMYTSGSTGNPKGVLMPGSSLLNLLTWQQKQFKNKHRHVLQFASLNFDVSFQEIFSTVCFGSTLYLISEDRRIDMTEVVKDITDQRITHLFIPFIVLKNLAEYILPICSDSFPLEEIIVAGEQLKLTKDIQAVLNKSKISLINQYGPTEAHVVSCYTINHNTDSSILPPIGKPIDNARIYIYDNTGELAPSGIVGELYIGGVQIARGYLNLPELTAEKFIKDQFSKNPGAVLYKTGDLARWLPNGNIDYVGRIDDQVKIRGYRIEIGEIESILMESRLIRQGVVQAREDKSGNKQLVGYIIPEGTFNKEALIAYLEGRLPKYMVPVLWVELQHLPVTSNGKVNRKILPDPDLNKLLAKEYIAPRSILENKLAKTWLEVLNVKRVGIYDNFFELGGHSLLAMRVVSAIRRQLEVELVIKDLFLHPTVAALGEHLQNHSEALQLPEIYVQTRPSFIPLSFSQERLWFIDNLKGSLQYHLPLVLKLNGHLNTDILAFAMRSIVNRHEVLRTVIREHEGEPYQLIREKDEWQLTTLDGSQFYNDPLRLQQCIYELIDQPFNLSQDYMLRAQLIKLNEQEHVLVVAMHHIAADGWSMSIFVKELAAFYKSSVEGKQVDLLPLELQYADYALWQRQYLQGRLLDTRINYWREQLQDVVPLQLPTDYPRSATQNTKGGFATYAIDKELTEQLQLLSQQQGATLFMTLLAAFKVLLYRYCNQEDICVGIAISDRQQQEVEELIGFFVNTLALRNKVSDVGSFIDLLQQVRITTLEAYEHREVPFEKVVEVVVKERDISRNPLFQVMFVWQNTSPVPEVDLGDVQLFQQEIGLNRTKFDINFVVTETCKGLQALVEYATDLYNESTIHRMMDHFKTLLGSIVQTPHQKIGELRMLTTAEEHQILYEFNDTRVDYPKDKTIVDLFEEQAARTPDAIALIFEEEQLSYRQLNERANQLAHYLRDRGVKEETLVPICIERSLEMIVGILGILKAGGVYVPIDPEYPQDRISYMLEDTHAAMVVSSQESRSKLPATPAVEVIQLGADWPAINEPTDNLLTDVQPHHLAYVIYTSGSTGKPKGVMTEHRNVVRLFETGLPLYDFDKNDVWTMFHSFCFDFSVWEMYGALFYGGRLVIVSREAAKDVALFAELLLNQQVTVLNQTPSAFYILQDFLIEKVNAVPIRYVIFGGEALNPSKLQPWKKLYSSCSLINMYGITETTVHVTYQEIGWQHISSFRSIIGKPIPTLSAYIADSNEKLVPIGVVGELYIGGAGLARGYLNRPELTSEKFIKDIFSGEEGSRLYKTGDLGRWLADGNIEYLGRKDDQVKIRGYRIELGEIENILQQSELVSHAVVMAKADGSGNKRLIGYVLADGAFNKEAIISYLKSKLPEYMVPSLWMELERLPLTSNGKVDRKALPDPDASELLSNNYVSPRNEVEEKLVAIWRDLLGVERVGIHDSFFHLGGHSLLAKRMGSAIERALLVSIPIHVLFQFITISDLGRYVEIQLNKYPLEKDAIGYRVLNI